MTDRYNYDPRSESQPRIVFLCGSSMGKSESTAALLNGMRAVVLEMKIEDCRGLSEMFETLSGPVTIGSPAVHDFLWPDESTIKPLRASNPFTDKTWKRPRKGRNRAR